MAELQDKKGPNAAARRDERNKSIADWLGDPLFKQSIEAILPRHLTGERFAAVALRTFKQVPALLDCTPSSVLASIIDSAQLGLEIGLGGECWLIPYEIKGVMTASLQIGYLGHLKLAWQSGQIASIEADVVTHDEVAAGRFEFQRGTQGFMHHRPEFDRVVTEKTIAYAYGVVWIKGSDRPIWNVIDAKQIERLRRTGRSANSPAWTNWFDQQSMAKALKRTLKWAPKARELAHAIALDDEADAGVAQTYQSRAEVAGLLDAVGQRSPEQREMDDALARRNQSNKPGVGESGEPDQGSGAEGTPPPIPPRDTREKVPVPAAKRRPQSENPAEDGDMGY